MGYWNSRGLRGSGFEELINLSNEEYRKKKIALVQKIPTPIVPVEMDSKTKIITKAYFEQKSTVDYVGVMNGVPLCFDAKETTHRQLPFSNIHPHQVEFMKDFAENGGLAFLLVHFTIDDAYYLLPCETLVRYYCDEEQKSLPREAFNEDYRIEYPSPYLNYMAKAYLYYKNTRG